METKDYENMTIAERIRDKSQRLVFLPTSRETVKIRALRGLQMLNAGLLPLTITRDELERLSEDEKEQRKDELLTMGRHVAVAVGIEPKYTLHETEAKDSVCIKDLDFDDVMAIFTGSITKTDERLYFGINNAAYDISQHFGLFKSQKEMLRWFFRAGFIFKFNPLELLDREEWQLALLRECIKEGMEMLKDQEGDLLRQFRDGMKTSHEEGAE